MLDNLPERLYHNEAMEDFVKQSLLLDFYGELLTEHQKEIYGAYIQENMTLSEIAEESGISRQGALDMVKRSRSILEKYEEKLHLVEKFQSIKDKVQEIAESESLEKVKEISGEILELL